MLIDRSRTAWPEQLGLGVFRAQLSPSVAKTGPRRQAYQTGLTQTEEFWRAAASVSALTSPVLRFYAVKQVCGAIIAASNLDDKQWKSASGHGLKVTGITQKTGTVPDLTTVLVEPNGKSTPQLLADILGSAALGGPATLVDLIAALPTQSVFAGRSDAYRLPIRIDLASGDSATADLDIVDGLSASFPVPDEVIEITRDIVDQEFRPYPSLISLPPWRRAEIWPGYPDRSKSWLRLIYEPGSWNGYFDLAPHVDEWRAPSNGRKDLHAIAFPSVGGNTAAQHPLVTWYLVLYAFSMIARYYPGEWRSLLDKDRNPLAAHIERLIDVDAYEAIRLAGGVLQQIIRGTE